jgi:hypothetical protein
LRKDGKVPRRPPEEIINANRNYIEQRVEAIDEKPIDIKASFMISFGSGSKNIALEYLLLAKPEESRLWFEKSANYYFLAKKVKDNNQDELERECTERRYFLETTTFQLIHSVILSENQELMTDISNDILEVPPHKTHNNHITFDYVKTFAMFILNSDDFYPTQINKYRELEDKYAKRFSGAYTGVAESLLAIYNKDNSILMEGVNQVLKQFFYKIRRSKERPICEEAIMLLKLAEIKGMKFDLGDIEDKYLKYIPKCMFEKCTP